MMDAIRRPAHYTMYAVESIELARELGFCMGNVVKYVLRAPWKNGVEDCDKALQFLEFELDSLRRGIPAAVFLKWKEDCGRLCDFLLKADGDILWNDIAMATLGILESVGNYLGTNMAEALPTIADGIRELRRVLELAGMEGQIYEGLSGRPKRERQ